MTGPEEIDDCFPPPSHIATLVRALHAAGLDTIDAVFAYENGQDIAKPGLGHRRRTRLTLATEEGKTHELYLKRYELEPFHRRFWRVLSEWRLDANPASAEGYNIEIARDARIPTMEVVAWDWASRSFTAGRSYIIVTAVPGEAISRCGKDFLARHAGENAGKRLATKLGDLAARMHKAGLVHRDFYSTHIFLDDRGDDFDLYLIDLARMFRPRWRKFRWRVKDLAQLKFSMPREWVDGHWETFLGEYLAKMGIDAGLEDRYRRAIDSKAAWMLRRRQRTAARREAAR